MEGAESSSASPLIPMNPPAQKFSRILTQTQLIIWPSFIHRERTFWKRIIKINKINNYLFFTLNVLMYIYGCNLSEEIN